MITYGARFGGFFVCDADCDVTAFLTIRKHSLSAYCGEASAELVAMVIALDQSVRAYER
jgi:hypothetical protein